MIKSNIFISYLIFAYGFFINPINGNTYPGLRRRPPPLTSVEETNILTQFVEDLARRRFQQKLVQDQFYNHLSQQHNQHDGPNPLLEDDYNSAPAQSFTYEFPEVNRDTEPTGNIEFAVNPSDPRYYEGRQNKNSHITLNDGPLNSAGVGGGSTKNLLNSYDFMTNFNSNNHNINKEVNGKGIFANNNSNKSVKDILFNKVKPPIDFTGVKTTQSLHSLLIPKPFRGRDDIAKLVQKLQQEGNANAVINGNPTSSLMGQRTQEVVVKERVGDNDVSMYMVALLSGITAAVVVAFIALGIAWITLQKRTKAAADVDYPAYGVTGPNKDLSPSGDKRLAQSAQLYHYQHQKQQIIGMENRQAEQTTGQSDVESDDDNEEGDYTVYECPGLASTGEMEVKNPLFNDDTPVSTPLSSAALTGTITTAITTSATATNTTNSPKHIQKIQNKPQSQQVQSVKQQQQQQQPPTTSSLSSSSQGSASQQQQQQQQQQNSSSRSQSPSSINRSPKSSKKEKQPPPTPQRKYKTGNTTSTTSTSSSSSSQQNSTNRNGQNDEGENNQK